MADQITPAQIQSVQEKVEHFLEGPSFKSLNHEQRKALKRELATVTTVSASVSHQYSGPLPPPDLLNQFNQVIPNGAERIMVMVEQQNKHRMGIETTVVKNQQWQSTLGQYFALFITMLGLALATGAIFTNHDTAGGTIGVAT